MNHAYIDASWQEQPDGRGLGGWGAVLLTPGQLAARYQGQLEAPDNNAAELRAVLEAVWAAPAGQPLTVHTDNQAVIACVARGRGPALLAELLREVREAAEERGTELRAVYAPRRQRHMLEAHALANAARRGQEAATPQGDYAEVLIEQRPAQPEARISLRRHGERLLAWVPLDALSELPPSTQALLAAVTLARPGEALRVRRASKVAQALWQRPERALPGAHGVLQAARAEAERQGVTVEFLGSA